MATTMLEKPEFKTIRLSFENYKRIAKFGGYHETMDDIVSKILNRIEVSE